MKHRFIAVAGLLALVAAACGGGGGGKAAGSDGRGATKTVRIEMRDLAYSPDAVTVDKGATVRFVFTNKGKVPHDAFIGDEAAQADHEEAMQMPDMSGGGGGGGAITVEPGRTGELTHTFAETGDLLIGCHQPGHYDAGMKVTVTVV